MVNSILKMMIWSHHKVQVVETSNLEGQLCRRVEPQNHQPLMDKILKLMRICSLKLKLALIRMKMKTFMERLRSFEGVPK